MFIAVFKIVLFVILSLFLITIVFSLIRILYLKIKGGYEDAKSEIKYRIEHQGRFLAILSILIDVFDKSLNYIILIGMIYVLIHGK